MNGPGKSMGSWRKVLCDGRRLGTTARSASCPEIRTKSSTKEADHVQVQGIKQEGRAKSHWTVKVDKKTATFSSKRKAEEAAAALRADLAARQPETASAENRAVAPAPEAQGASAPDTTTGKPGAQAAAPDTSAVAAQAVTHEDGNEIVRAGGSAGVQGVEGVESAEGVAGAHDVVVKLEPEDNLGDIKNEGGAGGQPCGRGQCGGTGQCSACGQCGDAGHAGTVAECGGQGCG